MSLDLSATSNTASEIAAARQADVVAFLHRAPFTLDAYKVGFLPGFREDCGYQQTQYQDLNIPVGMLDNDFRNPDLDRFVDRFFEHEPRVGVIGDVYECDGVDDHVAAAREIQASYPEAELIIVPKSRSVIDAIPEDLVLATREAMLTGWLTSSPTQPIGGAARPHPRWEPAQAARLHSTADPTDTHRRATGRHRRRRLERVASWRTVR